MTDYNFWKKQEGFPGLGRKLKISVFIPNFGGCAFYRLLNPAKKLQEHFSNVVEFYPSENPLGFDPKTNKETIDDKFFESDIIWTNNIPNFGINYLVRVCGIAQERGKLFWFDTDDLLTELYQGHRLEKVYKEQGLSDATKFVYFHSNLVSVTQIKFAERIKEFCGPRTALAVVKNAIDYTLPCWSAEKVKVPKDRFVRVGWAGGIHHEEDVKEFAGVPWLVNSKVGKENVRWDFYGKPPIDPNSNEKWQHDVWRNYENILARGFKAYKNYTINGAMNADQYGFMFSNMDVAIAPLQMNPFNDSKSEIKVAECGRYRVPLICSDVGCYGETIKNGVTGFLIEPGKHSTKKWVETMTKVIKDKDLRAYMGENLHKITEEHFDINKVAHNRLNFIKYYYDEVVNKKI
jgi:glycosyltransferase involved in cell wall biosynthesis